MVIHEVPIPIDLLTVPPAGHRSRKTNRLNNLKRRVVTRAQGSIAQTLHKMMRAQVDSPPYKTWCTSKTETDLLSPPTREDRRCDDDMAVDVGMSGTYQMTAGEAALTPGKSSRLYLSMAGCLTPPTPFGKASNVKPVPSLRLILQKYFHQCRTMSQSKCPKMQTSIKFRTNDLTKSV